jgi:Pvc16 N-terminal domain
MIDQLDLTLRRLFTTRVDGIGSDTQVGFQPPDEDWRSYAKNLQVGGSAANSLNVYLADLRENRRLRTNERVRDVAAGDVREAVAPRRVDCHYLISAWSPADVMPPALEPTLDEHKLLYGVADALAANDPIVPDEIFAPLPAPAALQGQALPIVLLPVEGFPKIAEFWGTMGVKYRWKPFVHLVVTIALGETVYGTGAIVTTVITRSLQTDAPAASDTRYHVGGQALQAGAGIARAWIELLDAPGTTRLKLVQAGDDGRFVFADVFKGDYQLRASSVALGATVVRPITVPEPSGTYDLNF